MEKHLSYTLSREPLELDVTIGSKRLRCLPEAPPMAVLDLLAARDDGLAMMEAMLAFLRSVVVDEDLPVLEELLRSKDEVVPIDVLGKVVTDLVEVYVARPTSSSNGSAAGPSGGGGSSTPPS